MTRLTILSKMLGILAAAGGIGLWRAMASPMPMDPSGSHTPAFQENTWWLHAFDRSLKSPATSSMGIPPGEKDYNWPSSPHPDSFHPERQGGSTHIQQVQPDFNSPHLQHAQSDSTLLHYLTGANSMPVSGSSQHWTSSSGSTPHDWDAWHNSLSPSVDLHQVKNVPELSADSALSSRAGASTFTALLNEMDNWYHPHHGHNLDVPALSPERSNIIPMHTFPWTEQLEREDTAYHEGMHVGQSSGEPPRSNHVENPNSTPEQAAAHVAPSIPQPGETHWFDGDDIFGRQRPGNVNNVVMKSSTIPASKFLAHHPQFVVISSRKRTALPSAIAEAIPDAPRLKDAINRYLFSSQLKWESKGEALLNSEMSSKFTIRRFIRRINDRAIFFQTVMPQLPGERQQIMAVPHRAFPEGSAMFEKGPDLFNSLLFSFWAPSELRPASQIQFVGSATLALDDATEVIRKAYLATRAGAHSTTMDVNSLPKLVLPTQRSRSEPIDPDAAVGLYSTSTEWLLNFPLVSQINPRVREGDFSFAGHLFSRLHRDVDKIKDATNRLFFGGHVEWQDSVEEMITRFDDYSALGTIRHHKRSSFVFISKPETLLKMPYQLVFLPYEVPGVRARLFHPSLRGKSHTFTLWAARDPPGGRYPDNYQFVGGGALSVEKAAAVLQHASDALTQLSTEIAHHL